MKTTVALGCAVLALLFGSASANAATMVHRSTTAGDLKIKLMIGPPETMSMKTTTTGEKILSGPMAACKMPPGPNSPMQMGGNTCNYHVELHVHTKAGKIVKGAGVSILLQNQKTHTLLYVPVSDMEGVAAGAQDFHYGNNMHVPAAEYNVLVTVNGTKAEFKNIKLGM